MKRKDEEPMPLKKEGGGEKKEKEEGEERTMIKGEGE